MGCVYEFIFPIFHEQSQLIEFSNCETGELRNEKKNEVIQNRHGAYELASSKRLEGEIDMMQKGRDCAISALHFHNFQKPEKMLQNYA